MLMSRLLTTACSMKMDVPYRLAEPVETRLRMLSFINSEEESRRWLRITQAGQDVGQLNFLDLFRFLNSAVIAPAQIFDAFFYGKLVEIETGQKLVLDPKQVEEHLGHMAEEIKRLAKSTEKSVTIGLIADELSGIV